MTSLLVNQHTFNSILLFCLNLYYRPVQLAFSVSNTGLSNCRHKKSQLRPFRTTGKGREHQKKTSSEALTGLGRPQKGPF